MSSMRNAVHRRNHKERAQPKEREKWGLLEKHKDYSLRAKDYNEKQERLKLLRQKAADRNPDEFHFAMMSSTTDKRGLRRRKDQEPKRLDHETAKLLKTQDAGYLRTILQSTRKARRGLEEKLLLLEAGQGLGEERGLDGQGGRLRFVEERGNEGEQRRLSKEEILRLAGETLAKSRARHGLVGETVNDGGMEGENGELGVSVELNGGEDGDVEGDEERSLSTEEKAALSRRRREIRATRIRLEAMRKREEALATAEQELEVQRGKMQNSVGSVNKNGVKFKIRERKR